MQIISFIRTTWHVDLLCYFLILVVIMTWFYIFSWLFRQIYYIFIIYSLKSNYSYFSFLHEVGWFLFQFNLRKWSSILNAFFNYNRGFEPKKQHVSDKKGYAMTKLSTIQLTELVMYRQFGNSTSKRGISSNY